MANNAKHTFNIEVTDTFGGEANYCWSRQFTVKAKTFRGAIQALSHQYGGYWSKDYDTGDMARYNMRNAAVCCFVSYAD